MPFSDPMWSQANEGERGEDDPDGVETVRFDTRRRALWRRLLGGLRYDQTIRPALEEVAQLVVSAEMEGEEDDKGKEERAVVVDECGRTAEPTHKDHGESRTMRYHPQLTRSFIEPLFEQWLAQADAPPVLEESDKVTSMETVDYSYILPLSALPHLHSLHLDLVIDPGVNSGSLLTETPFAHLSSLVPSLTRLTLRGAWEPDDETGTIDAEVDVQLILRCLSRLRELVLMALPIDHHAYLPLVLETHQLERLVVDALRPSPAERQLPSLPMAPRVLHRTGQAAEMGAVRSPYRLPAS